MTALVGLEPDEEGTAFAAGLHVLPDFHGNRSPLADRHAVGVMSGLTLDSSFDSPCRLYWRTAVGIALGMRRPQLTGSGAIANVMLRGCRRRPFA